MKLEEIVTRQKANARRSPGTSVREILPGGLVCNLELDGDQWRVQFLRIGTRPAPNTDRSLMWHDEIRTCRRFWQIPDHVRGTPVHNADMYAVNFVWSAIEQMALDMRASQ